MQFLAGNDAMTLFKTGVSKKIFWSPNRSVNPHAFVLGMSGSGKSHLIRNIVEQFDQAPEVKIHLFDVHGDLETKNESVVLYSETTGYGINPLEISSDPHFGGVRKRIESFIKTVEKATAAFGVKQVAVLRSILEELYLYYGIDVNKPATWGVADGNANGGVVFLEVDFKEKDKAKSMGARWNPGAKSWYVDALQYTGQIALVFKEKKTLGARKRVPTLKDLVEFILSRMEESFIGVGRDALLCLQQVHKTTASLNRMISRSQYAGRSLSEEDEKKLQSLKDKASEAVEDYLNQNATEKTLKEAMLYSSYDMLSSIYQRLKTLESSGVFRDVPAPFDPGKNVLRHNISPLSREEQKLFVLFSLEKMFDAAVQQGITDKIRTVIMLDESARYFDDEDSILSIIATEGRKFGISLVCCAQSPGHFSPQFISSVSTKFVLGIDESFWDSTKRSLNIDKERLAKIRPRQNYLMQTKLKDDVKSSWVAVVP